MWSALANLTNVTHSSHYQNEKTRMQNRELGTVGKGEWREEDQKSKHCCITIWKIKYKRVKIGCHYMRWANRQTDRETNSQWFGGNVCGSSPFSHSVSLCFSLFLPLFSFCLWMGSWTGFECRRRWELCWQQMSYEVRILWYLLALLMFYSQHLGLLPVLSSKRGISMPGTSCKYLILG